MKFIPDELSAEKLNAMKMSEVRALQEEARKIVPLNRKARRRAAKMQRKTNDEHR